MEDVDAGKAARQGALKEWVQAGVDDPESLDAAAVHARARKPIDEAVRRLRRTDRRTKGTKAGGRVSPLMLIRAAPHFH
jgi:hypothetical protein